MIAYFLRKSAGELDKLKLVKLLYLSERESFAQRGRPMNFDSYFSLEHGPVVSSALNGMDHELEAPEWDALSTSNRREIAIVGEIGDDRLSKADRRILDGIWDQFGKMGTWEIRDWTHKHCPEYVEVNPGDRKPIEVAQILHEVGRGEPALAAAELKTLQKEVGALGASRAA